MSYVKKTALILVTALLLLAVAGTHFVHLGKANPQMVIHYDLGEVAPDQNTEPPTISFFSPENDTVYGTDVVSLSLNVRVGDSRTASSCVLYKIYCKIDSLSSKTSVYKTLLEPSPSIVYVSSPSYTEFSETINLTGIPDGINIVTIHAVEIGKYDRYSKVNPHDNRETYVYYNSFKSTASSMVKFSVDATPPLVSVSSPENKTYYSPEILLNFTVNEKSSMVYSLDGQENVTVAGNTTLKNLPVGEHNVTVYATDIAGHTGASETIYFTIAEPFPIASVTAASFASVAVVSVVLLVHFKKRKS